MNDPQGPQGRRSLLLEVADRLLRHYGPQKTTIADVAREAGVGVGTVYLEFPSKDVLVEEISRARHRSVLDAMCAAAAKEGRSAGERLADVLDARLDAFLAVVAEGAHACDLLHCTGSAAGTGTSAVKSAQLSYHEEELALVADVLRRGAMAGELAVEDPEASARTVLRAYATFSTPWIRVSSSGSGGSSGSGDVGEAKRALAAMHRLVLQGLLSRRPPPLGGHAPREDGPAAARLLREELATEPEAEATGRERKRARPMDRPALLETLQTKKPKR